MEQDRTPENRLKKKLYDQEYCKANKELKATQNRNWAEANKEKVTAIKLKWKKNNPGSDAARRGQKRVSCPKHEKPAIREFYKNKPEGYHVDHEIPINHPLVCGLHCLANLQYLTARENLQKSNGWVPDWY